MALITSIGSKGGVGTSLVATNIASAMAHSGPALLVDLHSGTGVDDLLLGVSPDKSWAELLPVLDELQLKHIELATSVHASGLKLLYGPDRWRRVVQPDELKRLIQALTNFFDFVIVDLPTGLTPLNRSMLSISDVTLLITTADPPALRCAERFAAEVELESKDRVGLVINQINRQHPSTAAQIAESLDLPLVAALPPDPRAIGYQIHFGRACVQDASSMFGRAIRGLTTRLQQSAQVQDKSVQRMDQDRGIR
ncbi:MAG: AAA family ATPase [Anaerolineales bacterium]|jgi:Flp pilus assembly CpaE family ATPase